MSRKIRELEHLDDYVTGSMSDADAADFEDELFEAAAKDDAPEARWFERWNLLLGYYGQGDFLVRGGTEEDIDAARKTGMQVHVIAVSNGTTSAYDPPAGTDLIVTSVQCDVRDYDSVEASISNPDGRELHRFRDCLPDPKTGYLHAMCAAPLAQKAWGGGPRVCRITGVKRGSPQKQPVEIAVFYTKPA